MADKKNDIENISAEAKKDLADMFKRKDPKETGWLESDQLQECLTVIGVILEDEELDDFIEKFDKNRDGKLQISELLEYYHVLYDHDQNKGDLADAFDKFDANGDGYIRFSELSKILTFNGFMTGQESMTTISALAKYDRNGDGRFSYPEFVEAFLSDEYKNTIQQKEDQLEQEQQEQG